MRLRTLLLLLFPLWAFAQPQEEEVLFVNLASGLQIGGTLVRPQGEPIAVAVFVTGSGQQNRDEELLGHKPFKALADALAQKGIATLRCDDRGIGASQAGDLQKATTDDFATDAAAALAYADSVMGGKIPAGLIGHSEGGTIAIKQAASNPQCRFIVTLAAPAVRGDSLILSQVQAMLEAEGQGDRFEALYPTLRGRYDMVMAKYPSSLLKSMLMADVEKEQPDLMQLPQARAQAKAQIEMMALPWYREFLRYDPAADMQAISIPWLALNGEKDVQVPAANLQSIAQHCPQAQTMLMPGLNHLFLQCLTGSTSEYATLAGDIDPAVAEAIAQFIIQICKP